MDTQNDLKTLSKHIEAEISKQASGNQPKKASSLPAGIDYSLDIVAGVGVGCFLGYIVDKFFNTLPLFLIICTIFGFLGGLKNLIRRTNS